MSEAAISPSKAEPVIQERANWTLAKVTYVILMGFSLINYFWLMINGTLVDNIPPVIWLARLGAAGLAIWLGKLWQDKGFRILMVYFLWFFLRTFIAAPDSIFVGEVSANILGAFWAFMACYGLGRVLNPKQLKIFLLVCFSIWIVCIFIISCLGIHAAWKDVLYNEQNQIGLYRERLVFYYSTISEGPRIGIIFISILIIVFCSKKRFIKILLLCIGVPIVLAIALTDTRTVYYCLSAGIGVMAFICIIDKYTSVAIRTKKVKNQWIVWFAGILCMILVFIILVIIIFQITPLFNQVKLQGFIPNAYAEEIEKQKTMIAYRGFTDLNGRAELWRAVVNHLKQNPLSLLIGESKLEPTRSFNQFFAHCHNVYLQVLLESGIPGLLMLLSFMAYTGTNAIRLIQKKDQPLWIKLTFSMVVFLWVGDIADSFTWLRAGQFPMLAVLYIASGIVCAYGKKNDREIAFV